MKITSFLSVCTLALATAVAANHGQYEHKSMAPTHSGAPAKKPAHHWAAREAREHEHEAARYGGMKPTVTHHYARDADRKEEHEYEHTEEMKNDDDARDADHRPKHGDGKPEGHPHHARDEDRKPKHEPMHTGGAVVGKPGHHFIRSAAHPTSQPSSGSGNFAKNPFMGTRFTPESAIASVRGILTGQSGIKHTCDRCVAAMEVGQSLAHQASTADFSKAVVGLCKQVGYKSNSGCSDAFSVGKVGPYVSALQNADLGSDGKGFCKQYFGAC